MLDLDALERVTEPVFPRELQALDHIACGGSPDMTRDEAKAIVAFILATRDALAALHNAAPELIREVRELREKVAAACELFHLTLCNGSFRATFRDGTLLAAPTVDELLTVRASFDTKEAPDA